MSDATLTLRLPYCRPFRWAQVTRFYERRAIPGVEELREGRYRRCLLVGGATALLEVRDSEDDGSLVLSVDGVPADCMAGIEQRARDVFDLDAPVDEITRTLRRDTRLRALLKEQPGVRVAGAWDAFELTVRAVLGQQISVKAATTIAGRIAKRYGRLLSAPQGTLTHLFPEPARMRRARFNGLGLVRARADTLRRLSAAVDDGALKFDPLADRRELHRQLTSIKGIGDWTAQYVLMRAMKDPDALPASDLGLVKALQPGQRTTPAALTARAEAWRPWRAYAAMLLWGSMAAGGG